MKASAPEATSPRLPSWARKGSPLAMGAREVRVLLREQKLVTVCEEARCPNLGDCFERRTATFMILGDRCTRRCGYCSVSTAKPLPPDDQEPDRVAEAAARLGLRYVVITSVARDDLGDGGASHFVATVAALRARVPGVRVEVLVPDMKGDPDALRLILSAEPDVFNHNIETVPRLFPAIRTQGRYERSLSLLGAVKRMRPGQTTKSGLMVGLGESDQEISGVLRDLRSVGVDLVTLGQYLRPSREHAPVARFVTPEGFERLRAEAVALGFPTVFSGVFVRSSFHAAEVYRGLGEATVPPGS